MSSNDRTLTEDEIRLRVAAPNFFEELIASRTAALIEKGDPEAFAAWKEERLQKDRQFAELSADELLKVNEQCQQQSFDMQSVEFAAALTRFAAEAEIPLEERRLSPQEAAACYANVIREEWDWDLSAEQAAMPAEDMRFVVNREIEESIGRHRKATEPARHVFPEMAHSARVEFLNEQREVGHEALKSQKQSLQQSQVREILRPDLDD